MQILSKNSRENANYVELLRKNANLRQRITVKFQLGKKKSWKNLKFWRKIMEKTWVLFKNSGGKKQIMSKNCRENVDFGKRSQKKFKF